MSRFSMSSSLRQSLGMPSRNLGIENNEEREGKTRKSRLPVGAGAHGRPSTAAASKQRRKTYTKPAPVASQFGRRQTQSGAMGASRTSTGRSSMYGQGVTQMKKDPRPLSEKAYQAASIRKLIAFLSANNYPKTFTPKSLHTPTCKEFLNILNFMLEMVDDTLIVDGMNIVESVPKVLKTLGYPFTVSKNHLLNVGSPHSWPILLGSLTWLVDVCGIPDRTDEILYGDDFDQEGGVSAGEQEFQLMEVMYATYMEYGRDSEQYRELEERRMERARKTLEEYQEAVDKTILENEQLKTEIEELSRSSIPALQDQLRGMKEEHEELQTALHSDLLAIEKLNSDCVEFDAAASQTEVQIEECKRKAEEFEAQIRQQPMSAKEVQEIRQRIKENHEMLDKYREMVEDWNKQVSELQMKHNRTVSLIDNGCSHANDQLRRLAVILPDVASLSPLDYDTSKRADPEVLQKLVSHAKSLRHEVMVLHQKVASKCSELESRIISGEATTSTLSSEKVRKQLEIENVQHTLTIEKDALEQKKKTFEDTMKSGQAEKHALENQLMSLQQRIQEESLAQREHAAAKKELHSAEVNVERELGEKDRLYMEYFMTVTDLFETVQKRSKDMRKAVEEVVAEYKKLKIRIVDPKYLVPKKPFKKE